MSCNFDHSKVENVKTRISEQKEVILDLPLKTIDSNVLPGVTVLVVTRNRKKFAPIIIDNWKRINYPADKLQLLIVDDSDDKKMGPILELKELKDNRIAYCYVEPKKDGIHNIGTKRNHGIERAKYDFICIMDDDDYLYNDSILARVATLLSYNKGCVYSDQIAIYNIQQQSSYITFSSNSIPVGTMLFTKDFWTKQKFNESSENEIEGMINGREIETIRIPWFFNMIGLYHDTNHSDLLKTKKADQTMNIWKIFPKSFKRSIIDIKLK